MLFRSNSSVKSRLYFYSLSFPASQPSVSVSYQSIRAAHIRRVLWHARDMPADGPPTRGTADTDDTAAVEEKAQGLGVPAADASPAGVSVKIADDENVSS